VHTRRLFEALLRATKRAGATIESGAKAVSLAVRAGRVEAVMTRAGRFPCAAAVIAAGAWSGSLGDGKNVPALPVRPVKGEIVELITPPAKRLRHPLIASRCYLVPREDGSLLVGATEVEAGFDTTVTAGAVGDLLSAAREAVPDLGEFSFRSAWAGLRPTTPDRLPLLGPLGPKGLLVATGHYRKGILLAPLTAAVITDLVTKGKTSIPVDRFGPGRFAA
jgi:glycine oxidase